MTLVESQTPEIIRDETQLLIVRDTRSPEWSDGCDIEASVFIGAGYVSSKEELAVEYEPYIPHTEFIVAKRGGQTGGSVRLIHANQDAGLKTLNDIRAGRLQMSEAGASMLAGIANTDMVEVGTIAVAEQFRSNPGDATRLSVGLYGAIAGATETYGVKHVIASFDYAYYRAFKVIFGQSVKRLGPPIDYMGSPTVPVIINVPDLMENIKSKSEEMYGSMRIAAASVQTLTRNE